jgi:glycosyltransferase involved in cell wall biosynthesis
VAGESPPRFRHHTRRLRVLALVPRLPDVTPSQRFRIEQWIPHLDREHGIDVTLSPFESAELSELLARPGRRARKAVLMVRDLLLGWARRRHVRVHDAVFISREAAMIGPPWIERYVARSGVPLIYDFDDSIWLRHGDEATAFSLLLRVPGKVAEICSLASAVTVGNEYLAQYARQFSSQVRLVPTSIDLDRYPAMPRRRPDGQFRVVWTGSRSTLPYLASIRPALEALGARMPTTLRVICNRPPSPIANVTMEYVPWTPAGEVEALRESDVGIMPLPDTPTARGKCALKALQYMAVGRPAVISPVGVNTQLVRHGENGLHAKTIEDWVEQLERLAGDAELRVRLAAAGRRTLERGYTAAQAAAAMADVIRSASETTAVGRLSRSVGQNPAARGAWA